MNEETVNGVQYIEIEAPLNCTLYDWFGGTRTLTNGTFKGKFR